jgi:hypothetical protein
MLAIALLGTRVQAQPDPSLPPTFGSATLKAGFQNDPFTKKPTAGGTLETNLGGVNTHVTKAPIAHSARQDDRSPFRSRRGLLLDPPKLDCDHAVNRRALARWYFCNKEHHHARICETVPCRHGRPSGPGLILHTIKTIQSNK